MIRQTIAATKSATWAVGLHVRGQGLVPTGSGFFVGEGGLFATAAHVIEQHEPVQVIKERRGKEDSASLDVAEVAFCDRDADFALLKIATIPTRCSEVLPASLRIAARELDEGEPVYAYGYPLTVVGTPVHFSEEHLREWGIPLELIIGPDGRNLAELGGLPEGFRMLLMNHRLSPRTTSAIVSSQIEYYNTLDINSENSTHDFYVLDKALNYGNSGGPIVAAETGCVHALCTRFQPVEIRQAAGGSVTIPSLYGVVTRLTHPVIRAALEAAGATFEETERAV